MDSNPRVGLVRDLTTSPPSRPAIILFCVVIWYRKENNTVRLDGQLVIDKQSQRGCGSCRLTTSDPRTTHIASPLHYVPPTRPGKRMMPPHQPSPRMCALERSGVTGSAEQSILTTWCIRTIVQCIRDGTGYPGQRVTRSAILVTSQ